MIIYCRKYFIQTIIMLNLVEKLQENPKTKIKVNSVYRKKQARLLFVTCYLVTSIFNFKIIFNIIWFSTLA